jgi:hypothetical protein
VTTCNAAREISALMRERVGRGRMFSESKSSPTAVAFDLAKWFMGKDPDPRILPF